MTLEKLREKLRSHIFNTYRTQRKAAEAWGLKESRVSEILSGKHRIPDNILAELGYQCEKVVTFKYSKIKGK